MLGRAIVRIFGQAPLARLVDDLPAEGTFFSADDEPAVLKGAEGAERCGLADLQLFIGLANAVGNAAIVGAVVPLGDLYVERPCDARQAQPGGRVQKPMSKTEEALGLAAAALFHGRPPCFPHATPSPGRR